MITAQQVYRNLERGDANPICLVVGEEPFQATDIESRFRRVFIRTDSERQFNLEIWDGDHLDASRLLNSLETMPGLFAEANSKRLIILKQFERAPAAALEVLETYCKNPSPDSQLLIFAAKADRRRGLYKCLESKADWIEINEPYEREWPKWQSFFERKCGRRIDLDAWEMLVTSSRSLSLVWAEVEKLVVYIGDGAVIGKIDVLAFAGGAMGVDIFAFVDDVVHGRQRSAMEKLHHLLLSGESEIKLLSLLVRQFRHLDQVKRLIRAGVVDLQIIASQVGIHRYGVQSLIQNAKRFSDAEIQRCFFLLSEADYRMKLGGGGLFENFLTGYFREA